MFWNFSITLIQVGKKYVMTKSVCLSECECECLSGWFVLVFKSDFLTLLFIQLHTWLPTLLHTYIYMCVYILKCLKYLYVVCYFLDILEIV